MALIDWTKSESLRETRSGSARPASAPKVHPALTAFFRGRLGKSSGFAGKEVSSGDHISLMKKHPKLFG